LKLLSGGIILEPNKPLYPKAGKMLFPNKIDRFLSDEEKDRIVQAIRDAEKNSSGEIRVHAEYYCRGEPLERAKGVFEFLGMTNTRERNGVLIYVSFGDRKLAVLGDSGISERVSLEFWEEVKNQVGEELTSGHFCRGICLGVKIVGEKLKELFPRQPYDVNELKDEISFGSEDES
jgi:uncharacterized membrane protein